MPGESLLEEPPGLPFSIKILQELDKRPQRGFVVRTEDQGLLNGQVCLESPELGCGSGVGREKTGKVNRAGGAKAKSRKADPRSAVPQEIPCGGSIGRQGLDLQVVQKCLQFMGADRSGKGKPQESFCSLDPPLPILGQCFLVNGLNGLRVVVDDGAMRGEVGLEPCIVD